MDCIEEGKMKQHETTQEKASDLSDLPFHGDQTFSEAATFKHDAMIS
jgi:hypothetical protein